jgi:hypothetical protein
MRSSISIGRWVMLILTIGLMHRGWGWDPHQVGGAPSLQRTTVERRTDYRLGSVAIPYPHLIRDPTGAAVVGVTNTTKRIVIVPIATPTTATTVATVPDQDLRYVRVASWTGDDGQTLLVWNDARSGTVTLHQRLADGTLDAPIVLWNRSDSFPVEPAVARLTDGRVLVVWRNGSGTDGRLRYRVGSPDASAWSDPAIVHPTPGYRSRIGLAARPHGAPEAWLTYTAHLPSHPDESQRVQSWLIRWDGAAFTDPEPIRTADGMVVDAMVVHDVLTDRLVVAGRIVDRSIVVLARPASAAPSTPWTTVVVVPDRTAEAPVVAYDRDGDLHMVWTRGSEYTRVVGYRLWDHRGCLSPEVTSANQAAFSAATLLPLLPTTPAEKTVSVAYALVLPNLVQTRIMDVIVRTADPETVVPPPAGAYQVFLPLVMQMPPPIVVREGC